MALNLVTRATTLSFLVLLAIATCLEARGLKRTNMVFYVQDYQSDPNVTTFPIAGIPSKPLGILQFGTVFVVDNDMTETIDRNSTQIGRVQGICTNSKLDGTSLHCAVSLVFSNKKYNESTLEIQGANRFLQIREMSVVSGTRKFRLARGYVTLETVYFDSVSLNGVIRWNLTLFHY